MDEQTTQQAINEIWALFRETDARFKENDARLTQLFAETNAKFKETDAKFKETDAKFKETDAKFKETDAKFKETDVRLDQLFAETDARLDQRFAETDARLDQLFAETDAQFKKTDARLDELFAETDAKIEKTTQSLHKLEGLFSNQWGRLIEALVRPGVLKLFQERGHKVRRLHQRSTAQLNGTHMEIDITMVNEIEVIPIEVKSTLKIGDVNDFLTDLAQFTHFFPEYKNYRVYGAVAGLDISLDVSRYAYRKGLFVITITGDDIVEILNSEKFAPKNFGPENTETEKFETEKIEIGPID